MKIYIWPDGGWCEEHELEKFQTQSGRSDDCALVDLPENCDGDQIDVFVTRWLRGQEYVWESKVQIHGCHKIFLEKRTGKYALCDWSGKLPHKSNDGVLWIDTEAPIVNVDNAWGVPVITLDGQKVSTAGNADEAAWLVEHLHMSIQVGGLLFRQYGNSTPRIPRNASTGDLNTRYITRKDAELLGLGGVPGYIGSTEYGFFIETHSVETHLQPIKDAGMSDAYIKLLRLCQAQGLHYLLLDQDGSDTDGLEEFTW